MPAGPELFCCNSDSLELVPKSDIPDCDVPASDIPDCDVPASDIPDCDVPESDIPDCGVLESLSKVCETSNLTLLHPAAVESGSRACTEEQPAFVPIM